MADQTHIEWTDATWNVITGCSVVSPGCTHCYAMKLAGTRLRDIPSRKGLTNDTKAGPVWNGEVRFNEEWLDQPLRWKKPRKIFVCAHGDLFHEGVGDAWLDEIFAVMALAPQHTFQILTKRAERMRDYLGSEETIGRIADAIMRLRTDKIPVGPLPHLMGGDTWWPLANVWAGVSAEDQKRANERIFHLRHTPAAVRWISAEPLLGAMDLTRLDDVGTVATDALRGVRVHPRDGMIVPGDEPLGRIDWVVVGGESGPGARPMHVEWARKIRDQCAAAGTPFLFKQWGSWAPVCAIDVDALYDRLYHPAPKRLGPEATRRPRTAQTVLHRNGDRFDDVAAWGAFHAGSGAMTYFETGKTLAGRSLDGTLHDGYPAAPHA